jgi:Flp pilus assembly CpaF family ATPase
MEWIVDKTGVLLNTSAQILDNVVQSGSRFEATLSPAAMRVVKASMSMLHSLLLRADLLSTQLVDESAAYLYLY